MKIIDVKLVDRFRVFLRFDDGASGIVDLGHFAGRGVFQAWEQAGVFEHVSISPVGALHPDCRQVRSAPNLTLIAPSKTEWC
jgi:Protein of unknown function (DUF2442)